MMKAYSSTIAFGLLVLSTPACISYTQRTPQAVVVAPTPVQQQIITTLPLGYTARVYHGVTYYKYNNVYYQTVNLSNGKTGYVIVDQPW
jgi:hypothetical protein